MCITLIFKTGNKNDILNYKPIAITGTISKIFDSIMAKHLTDLCILYSINHQHGFVKGRFTITNLLFYSSFISDTKSVTGLCQVDSIYLDFAKAFDSPYPKKRRLKRRPK